MYLGRNTCTSLKGGDGCSAIANRDFFFKYRKMLLILSLTLDQERKTSLINLFTQSALSTLFRDHRSVQNICNLWSFQAQFQFLMEDSGFSLSHYETK